jgi:hypothetical protein
MNVGYQLFIDRAKIGITFLKAGEAQLITSDQPLINMRAAKLPADTAPEEFEAYYPLSPTTALLLDANDAGGGGRYHRSLTREEAMSYNRALCREAHEQAFGADETILKQILEELE